MKRLFILILVLVLAACSQSNLSPTGLESQAGTLFINVLLNTKITPTILGNLGTHGTVRGTLPSINALTMKISADKLAVIKALPYVAAANPDAKRNGAPVDTVAATDFSTGLNTWDLDAVNVTDSGAGRTIGYDGTGVYVAVLDTGLLKTWRQYFPQERIATQYGIAFGGGGGEQGSISTPTNKWEIDQNSHGTHVTSSIIGYNLRGTAINGVATKATIIPVKVLNQNGSGWSSVIAAGITYVADLKAGPLAGSPVVINMSLGGSVLDAVEKAAIDYAISKGVIIVASAGNSGDSGMGYPGAYAPVVSVAASGWTEAWKGASRTWWINGDVSESNLIDETYIATFSSRQLAGQDLDVAAPGHNVVGPYQVNGQISYFFLSGTSMASPHVAGIAALMAQKSPSLTQGAVETILQNAAIPLPAGCRNTFTTTGAASQTCWGANATGSGIITADAALALTW